METLIHLDEPVFDIDPDEIEAVHHVMQHLGLSEAKAFVSDELGELLGPENEWESTLGGLYTLESVTVNLGGLISVSFYDALDRRLNKLRLNIAKLSRGKRDYAARSNSKLLSLSDTKDIVEALKQFDDILEESIKHPESIDDIKLTTFMEQQGVLSEVFKKIKSIKVEHLSAKLTSVYAAMAGVRSLDTFKDYAEDKLKKEPISERGWSNLELKKISGTLVDLLESTMRKRRLLGVLKLYSKGRESREHRVALLRSIALLKVSMAMHRKVLMTVTKAVESAV